VNPITAGVVLPSGGFYPLTLRELLHRMSREVAQWHSKDRQGCARDRPSRDADVRALSCVADAYLARKLRDSSGASPRAYCSSRRKRFLVLEGWRHDAPRLRVGPDRQSFRRSPNDRLRDHCMAVNGINNVDAVIFVIFGQSLSGA
jgi:hypothetical protein